MRASTAKLLGRNRQRRARVSSAGHQRYSSQQRQQTSGAVLAIGSGKRHTRTGQVESNHTHRGCHTATPCSSDVGRQRGRIRASLRVNGARAGGNRRGAGLTVGPILHEISDVEASQPYRVTATSALIPCRLEFEGGRREQAVSVASSTPKVDWRNITISPTTSRLRSSWWMFRKAFA